MTVAADSVDLFLQQPAQAPVVLHPVLEFGVLRVGRLEVGHGGEQLGVAVGVGGRGAVDHREQLPLVDEVAVAAQRRARPEVLRDARDPGAAPGRVLILTLPLLLRAIEPGTPALGQQPPQRC